MKKKITVILLCVLFAVALGGKAVYELWENGFFIFERTATVYGEWMEWDGRRYLRTGGEYSEGRTIAKAQGGWTINEVEQDPSHTFIVARSFLDSFLYVADDYTIPTGGNLTKAAWGERYIRDDAFLEAIAKIDAEKTTNFSFETDAIFAWRDTQQMRDLSVAYENCPVAAVYKGYLGKVDGNWVITTHIPLEQTNEDGSPKVYTVDCYLIPEQYHSILEKHFR